MSTTSQPKWFLQLKGHVQGPFNNENLLKAIQSVSEENLTQALVWKRGLSEWLKATQWQKADQQIAQDQARPQAKSSAPSGLPPRAEAPKTQLKNPTIFPQATQATRIESHDNEEHTKTVVDNELFEKTFAQAFSDGVFYRVQLNFVDQPLMSKNDLIQLIAKQDDISGISIQDPKTKEWKELYAFPDLVEKLGISRRKSQRVPILAQFNGKSNKSKSVSYRVITISEGGLGFTENFDLKIGDEVEGQVTSPHFFQPLTIKADVIYAGLDGYIGLKFSSITDETKAAIIEYIKKFGKNQKS